MSVSQPEHQVTVSKLDLPFIADQLAQLEALLSFVVDSVRTSETYHKFQAKLDKELKQVKVTRVINVDDWLRDQDKGFIARVRPVPIGDIYTNGLEWNEQHPVDYWRDEEGFPIIYNTPEDLYQAIDRNRYNVVNIIDLKDDYAKRHIEDENEA